MLIHSRRGSLKPEQIARLLRRVLEAEDRAAALRRLLAARERMSYDDLAAAVKTLAAKNAREQAGLRLCLRVLFGAR